MFSCAWLLVGRGYSNRMIIIAANSYRHAFMRTCLPAYSTSHSHSYVDTQSRTIVCFILVECLRPYVNTPKQV